LERSEGSRHVPGKVGGGLTRLLAEGQGHARTACRSSTGR